MDNPQASPMSQLLTTLGITREDLSKRSDQMRQFLTSDAAPTPRAADHEGSRKHHTFLDSRATSTAGCSKDASSRSLSRARTNSLRESTPPSIASVKAEPSEPAIPSRSYTTMDMVIERQRRQNRKEKKSRKDKERESSLRPTLPPAPPSPSPKPSSQAFVSLDSFMKSRAGQKTESADGNESAESDDMLPVVVQAPLPVTPQKNSYYREHTRDSTLRKRKPAPRDESPTPTRSRARPQPPAPVNPYTNYVPFSHYLPIPVQNHQASTSALPITPKRHQSIISRAAKSPLPPSSSPPPSSPASSPSRPIVNLVSSPGPMGPEPTEDEYEDLPFALPPGPYSPTKPEQSYAALVGQAILSSPEHRLTLQEIYEWITIVYPYFKRGETTWMNSIRHVLSTTVVFRKVVRDRSLGRTQWAIWDEDLECFKGGGFKKHLCKDYVNANAGKDKQGTGSRSRTRKRDASDDTSDGRKTKRRKDRNSTAQTIYPLAPLIAHPLFPPTRPSAHHQPYYESCLPQGQPVSADLIFPPLPPAAALSQVIKGELQHIIKVEDPTPTPPLSSPDQHPPTPAPSSESVSSAPELTSRASSFSPPTAITPESDAATLPQRTEDACTTEVDGINPSSLTLPPVPSSESIMPRPGSLLQLYPHSPNEGISKERGKKKDKGKNKVLLFPPLPPSPTLGRKVPGLRAVKGPPQPARTDQTKAPPSNSTAPSTPPRKKRALESSNGSPIAAKCSSISDDLTLTTTNQSSEVCGTPSRRNSIVLPASPVTPKKLFPSTVGESPFRTPLGLFEGSPFRTPGSRLIFDPHDPRTLLDDELNRLSSAQGESPGGLYGKGVGTLLYDSPGVESPGKWTRWW